MGTNNSYYSVIKMQWCNYNSYYSCWKRFMGVCVLFHIITFCGIGDAIKNVGLYVDPIAVRVGQHATLRCVYDLEGIQLYSVKFYRGLREFYRYSPNEVPSSKIFPFPGIHVDITSSNASQVVLRSVPFNLAGNFSCEVTAEAPSFSSDTARAYMQVVAFPEKRPSLWTDRDRYEPGDVIRANCSSPPSKPSVDLTFSLNSLVLKGDQYHYNTSDRLEMSRITLRFQLQSSHFAGTSQGTYYGLTLRCTASIDDLYQEHTEIELGVPQRDPIPARVTSSSADQIWTTYNINKIIILIIIGKHIFSCIYANVSKR